ncbi:MAG: hypothetical protein U0R80_09240 [Nocardioidaceae bacterium]
MSLPARRLVALGAAAALGLGGCTSGGGSGTAPKPDTGTPLAQVDTLAMTVVRGPFCDRISPQGVERALGGDVAGTSSYDSGDRARLTGEVTDVAHEFSCTFRAEDGTAARAWVFAPPVTRSRARELAAAVETEGCTPVPAPAAFGRPTSATRCETGRGTSITFRGLFGDAWLSCSVTTPSPDDPSASPSSTDLVDRAGRWCVEVTAATSAG